MAAEVRRAIVNATPDGRVSTRDASVYTGLSEKTLANWRSLDQGPVYIRIGGMVTYRLADLDDFVASNQITPASSEGRERALVRPVTRR